MITPIRHNLRDKRGQKRRFLRSVIVVPFNSSVCYVRRAVFLLVALSLLVVRLVPAAEKMVDFSREVLPILSDNCFACHGTGAAGAPKLGDKAAWAPRLAQDIKTLHQHAIEGFTGDTGFMPPRGGFANLSDEEVEAAVDYMVHEDQ